MRKKISVIFVIIGALLIFSALALVLFNVTKAKKCTETAQNVLVQMKNSMPIEYFPNKEQEKFEQIIVDEIYPEIPEYIEIDGNKFIGYIRIEKIGVELPVMQDWSYEKMDVSPCVYKGSLDEKNLIVMAHNYSGFFIDLKDLSSDDLVEFVKCSGEVLQFKVTNIELIAGYDGETLVGDEENWDLTLLTCNYSGRSRVVVRTLQI